MTWRELQQFTANLDPQFLDEKILVQFENGGCQIAFAQCFNEDQINPTGEGIEPVSSYINEGNYEPNEPVVYHKGHPMLYSFY